MKRFLSFTLIALIVSVMFTIPYNTVYADELIPDPEPTEETVHDEDVPTEFEVIYPDPSITVKPGMDLDTTPKPINQEDIPCGAKFSAFNNCYLEEGEWHRYDPGRFENKPPKPRRESPKYDEPQDQYEHETPDLYVNHIYLGRKAR